MTCCILLLTGFQVNYTYHITFKISVINVSKCTRWYTCLLPQLSFRHGYYTGRNQNNRLTRKNFNSHDKQNSFMPQIRYESFLLIKYYINRKKPLFEKSCSCICMPIGLHDLEVSQGPLWEGFAGTSPWGLAHVQFRKSNWNLLLTDKYFFIHDNPYDKFFFMSPETKSHVTYSYRLLSVVVRRPSVNNWHFRHLLQNPQTDFNEILQKSFIDKGEPKLWILSSPDPRGQRGGAKKGKLD